VQRKHQKWVLCFHPVAKKLLFRDNDLACVS
jgi:hypothetical protein